MSIVHGQVHTLAIYLTYLPYEEQCYWRGFNEKPKGAISTRSFETDFLVRIHDKPDPINELKVALSKLSSLRILPENLPLWQPENSDIETSFHGFYYVLSENRQEWQIFIQHLCKIVNEGLVKKTITKLSERLGCYDSSLGSIILLKKCLENRKIDSEIINDIIQPLVIPQKNRTEQRGGRSITNNFKEDAMNQLLGVTNAINVLNECISSSQFE